MTQYGTRISYSGTAKIMLAFVLLAAAGGVTYAATQLPVGVRPASWPPRRIRLWPAKTSARSEGLEPPTF